MCTGLPKQEDSAPRRLWRLPGVPPQHRCSVELVGLALVAAIQAELDTITAYESPPCVYSHPSATQLHPPKASKRKVVGSNPKFNSCSLPLYRDEDASPKSLFTLSSSPINSTLTLCDGNYDDDNSLSFNPRCFTACSLCRRPLIPTKDIYMYRDDQAFCTKQCRQHQILIDEQKEKSCSDGRGPKTTFCHFKACSTSLKYENSTTYKTRKDTIAYM
ncbi:hypothetical protein L7F22_008342 [Adiantum nelumboides]|nr:hypothetical protein [Adiantum nelumboides]